MVAGLIDEDNAPDDAQIESEFKSKIVTKLVDLKTGEYVEADAAAPKALTSAKLATTPPPASRLRQMTPKC